MSHDEQEEHQTSYFCTLFCASTALSCSYHGYFFHNHFLLQQKLASSWNWSTLILFEASIVPIMSLLSRKRFHYFIFQVNLRGSYLFPEKLMQFLKPPSMLREDLDEQPLSACLMRELVLLNLRYGNHPFKKTLNRRSRRETTSSSIFQWASWLSSIISSRVQSSLSLMLCSSLYVKVTWLVLNLHLWLQKIWTLACLIPLLCSWILEAKEKYRGSKLNYLGASKSIQYQL